MEIKDNKTGVPLEHYTAEFAAADPQELSLASGIAYDAGTFRIRLMGRPVAVRWPVMTVSYEDDGSQAKANVRILCARRILQGKAAPFNGSMLSYVEMPWGNVYQKQFDGRCIKRLAFGFGNSLEKFKEACEKLAGLPAKGGDLAYDVPFMDGLTVRMMIWEGDDEFPPNAQFLFSDNFPAAFSAEDIAVTGDIILDAMKGRW